jgi:hypothetical protein
MIRRAGLAIAGVLIGCAAAISPAHADHQPVIVVPGRSDVPVMINGVDARGAAVYGDWGLYRAGHGSIMIEGVGPGGGGPASWPRGYYPATGRPPAYGRREIVPPANRPAQAPAPTYYRSWSAGSAPGPVTDQAPYTGPAVIGDPRGYRHRRR